MTDLNLNNYNDFNESKDVIVSKINIEGNFNSGLCTYKKDSNTTFYLRNPVITYVNNGMKYMLVNKQEFVLNEGDFLFIPKNSIVFTDIKVDTKGFQSINILFPTDLSNSNLILDNNNSACLNSNPFAIYKDRKVIKQFENVLVNNTLDNVNLKNFIEFILKSFPKQIFSSLDKNVILSDEISTISSMIIETIYDNISLSEMAESCNMSLATFKRKFTKEYGISPKKWIRNTRLQAAFFHLKTNNLSVTEVAVLTGFDNLAHFSYSFKKYFNITPSSVFNKIEPISITLKLNES